MLALDAADRTGGGGDGGPRGRWHGRRDRAGRTSRRVGGHGPARSPAPRGAADALAYPRRRGRARRPVRAAPAVQGRAPPGGEAADRRGGRDARGRRCRGRADGRDDHDGGRAGDPGPARDHRRHQRPQHRGRARDPRRPEARRDGRDRAARVLRARGARRRAGARTPEPGRGVRRRRRHLARGGAHHPPRDRGPHQPDDDRTRPIGGRRGGQLQAGPGRVRADLRARRGRRADHGRGCPRGDARAS